MWKGLRLAVHSHCSHQHRFQTQQTAVFCEKVLKTTCSCTKWTKFATSWWTYVYQLKSQKFFSNTINTIFFYIKHGLCSPTESWVEVQSAKEWKHLCQCVGSLKLIFFPCNVIPPPLTFIFLHPSPHPPLVVLHLPLLLDRPGWTSKTLSWCLWSLN